MSQASLDLVAEIEYCLFRSDLTKPELALSRRKLLLISPLPLLHFLRWISPKLGRDLSWGGDIFQQEHINEWTNYFNFPKRESGLIDKRASSWLMVSPQTLSYGGGWLIASNCQTPRAKALGRVVPLRSTTLDF